MTTFYIVLIALFAIFITLCAIFVAKTAKETAKADSKSKWKNQVLADSSSQNSEPEDAHSAENPEREVSKA